MDSWLGRLGRGLASDLALRRSSKAAGKAIEYADAALKATEAACGVLLRELDGVVDMVPEENMTLMDVARALEAHAEPVRQVVDTELRQFRKGLANKRKHLAKFTVTLFGRTMAGKSTIREAITGGDGSTIGKGAQRTTRDIREYPWRNIRLVDTPGFGAFDGKEDRELAFSTVDESDLILFLLSSDGIQEESFREMAELNRLRKPVLFVLNVKLDLTKDVYCRRFLADPAKEMAGRDFVGHRARVESLVKEHFPATLHEIRLIPVQAQAAFLCQQKQYQQERGRLLSASGIIPLLHELENELLKRGPMRRIQTIVGGSATLIGSLEKELEMAASAFAAESVAIAKKLNELNLKIEVYCGAFPKKCRTAVAQHFAFLRKRIPTLVEENLHRDDFDILFRNEVRCLGIEEWSKRFCESVAGEVAELLEGFTRELEIDLKLAVREFESQVRTARPIDWRRAARWTSTSVAIVSFVVGLFTPVGWVGGLVGGIVIALGFLSKFLPGWEEQMENARREAREKLERQIDENSARTGQEIERWFEEKVQTSVLGEAAAEVISFRDGVAAVSQMASDCARELRETKEKLGVHYPDIVF